MKGSKSKGRKKPSMDDKPRKSRKGRKPIDKKSKRNKRNEEKKNLDKILDDERDTDDDQLDKPKQIPRTVENTRIMDETLVDPNNEEVVLDLKNDEMESHWDLSNERNPRVLITTSDNPHTRTIQLCRELKNIIPKSEFRFRNRSAIKKIIRGCIERNYTDLIVINENRREPNGLLLVHLPNGPTAKFRLSSVKLSEQIPHVRKPPSYNRPEAIFNNFETRLGKNVGRMLACLFPKIPKFKCQTVCTFHNQRDYIFFRYHHYDIDEKEGEVSLQECGPQFTLKLMSLQTGTFDPQYGEYEWILKRHEMQKSRKRFYL